MEKSIKTTNPANEQSIAEYAVMTAADLENRLKSATAIQVAWSQRSLDARLNEIVQIKSRMVAAAEQAARLMTAEMGKPITQSRAEIQKCLLMFDVTLQNAERWFSPQEVDVAPDQAWVEFHPLGVLLAIMPWNFPFWQVIRFALPQIALGNVILLKHASNTTGCSLLIEEIFGIETIQSLVLPGQDVGKLIPDSRIRGVTITGSTTAGREVASAAGHALKKHVLELGGSDAYVILGDADVARAAKLCVQSRLINSGQSCIAAKRFIVNRRVGAQFISYLKEEFQKQVVGDPTEEKTTVGPLARLDLRSEIVQQIEQGNRDGFEHRLGGQLREGRGAYFEPGFAVLKSADNILFQNEVFGPFAAVVLADDDETAVRLANRSVYGLGGALFTQDEERGRALARRMQCGSCFINDFVKSDPRVPFGGVKESGHGRELTEFGAREFANVQTIWCSKN